jgi:SAM-dependent methyltransferase
VAARVDRAAWKPDPAERYRPAAPSSFDAGLARARKAFPKIFKAWRTRLDAMQEAIAQTKEGNAAHAADVYSRLFRSFVETHIAGRVLDVGCGVFGRPYYLESYPAGLISGIEPLEPRAAADFELVRGLAEFLPWDAGAFSTIVSATALDHSLSLEAALAEKIRVLRPDGKLLLWIGNVPGAPNYEPDSPAFAPADKFHLFHFDVAWFEPMLEQRFRILDRLEFRKVGYSHVFYALRPKPIA